MEYIQPKKFFIKESQVKTDTDDILVWGKEDADHDQMFGESQENWYDIEYQ